MTKDELEKATGQELIDARNYCGVDGYYRDYLENVNAEMLKRFNRLAELERENAELKRDKEQLTKAKKIIGNLYAICKDNHYLDGSVLIEQAEQFLKEVS